jgi:hypothetical protein
MTINHLLTRESFICASRGAVKPRRGIIHFFTSLCDGVVGNQKPRRLFEKFRLRLRGELTAHMIRWLTGAAEN